MLVGDDLDEALAEALPAILGIDREKEEIAVAARRRKTDEVVVDEEEMDRRSAIGVGEKPAALFEHVLPDANVLFQPPRGLDVGIVARPDDLQIDVDTHYQ